jgi:chromosomal replication initiator protein
MILVAARKPSMPLFPIPFVPLKEHAVAQAAVRCVRRSVDALPGLLYLTGANGVGKTAFVSAIAEDPEMPVSRIESTDLLRLRLDRLSDDRLLAPLFDEDGDPLLLICENVQRLKSHETPQRHLARVIDNVLARRGIVVLTASKSPGEIGGLAPRLLNRFRSGVITRLEPPDADGRRRLIDAFCRVRRLTVTDEAAELLTELLPPVPRDLFAALMHLESTAALQSTSLTGEFVRSQITAADADRRRPTITAVTRAVAKELGIPAPTIRGESRRATIGRARRIAMFLCRELTGASLTAIGKSFGGRSHTAVKHACGVVESERTSNAAMESCLRRLRNQLES